MELSEGDDGEELGNNILGRGRRIAGSTKT